MMKVKFSGHPSAFYQELKTKVNACFESQQRSRYGNCYVFFKALFLLLAFGLMYGILLLQVVPVPVSLLLCVLMGLTAAAIGFNIMHDGNHGSFSSSRIINTLAGLTLNLLGGSSMLWKIKHNQLHHTFTNVEGHDDDIANEPFIRMQSSQKRYWFHRFQHHYWVIIYSLMYLGWICYFDFVKYFRRRIGSGKPIRIRFSQHAGFWFTKACFVLNFVLIPLQAFSVGEFLMGFLIFALTTGLVISIIFQLAHAVEGPEFINPQDDAMLLADRATHQVRTTANFATGNRLITAFTGGLNYQIEHHLFPRISHVHYPVISPVVRKLCACHHLPYHEWPNLKQAMASHIRFLKKMGNSPVQNNDTH
jgi:linoleoyl-CoA desaturase